LRCLLLAKRCGLCLLLLLSFLELQLAVRLGLCRLLLLSFLKLLLAPRLGLAREPVAFGLCLGGALGLLTPLPLLLASLALSLLAFLLLADALGLTLLDSRPVGRALLGLTLLDSALLGRTLVRLWRRCEPLPVDQRLKLSKCKRLGA